MNILIVIFIVLDISAIIALDVLEEKRRKEREDEEAFDRWYEANKEQLIRTAITLKASAIDAHNIKASEIDPNTMRVVLTGHGKADDEVDEEVKD